MKKLILLASLISSLSLPSVAQFNTYHPFPRNNAYWTGITWHIVTGNNVYNVAYTCFDNYLDGDTIVNGKNYVKVRTSGGYIGTVPSIASYWEDYDNFVCLLREDTIAQKVYGCFPPNYARDTLLYDFSLKQGDYLHKSYLIVQDSSFLISAIDSILVGHEYRKQFIIANMRSSPPEIFDSIIEGVGASTGLLEQMIPPFEAGSWLACFDNTSENIVYAPSAICQRFYLAVPSISKPDYSISVYPNPSSGIFNLVIASEARQSLNTIEIYNVLGQSVFTETLRSVQGDNTINLNNQPNGIYLYRVISETGNLVGEGKVVVQR